MLRRYLIGAFALTLLLGIALPIWRDEARRPRYIEVPLEQFASGEADRLVGKRIVVDGYVRPAFGVFGGDYGVFAHSEDGHPSGPPALIVRPRPGDADPSDRERVFVRGILQASPNGLLLISERPPPPPLWEELLSAAIIAIPFAAGAGVLILASRALLRRWRSAAIRVRRVARVLTCALLLALSAATAVLWVRSYRHLDGLRVGINNWTALRRTNCQIQAGLGELFFRHDAERFSSRKAMEKYLRDISADGMHEGFSGFTEQLDDFDKSYVYDGDFATHLGFGIRSWRDTPFEVRVLEDAEYGGVRWRVIGTENDTQRDFVCPLWFVVLLFSLLPIRWTFVMLRLHDRRKNGACLHCGYSLQGNTSGVCPECGSPCEQPSETRTRSTDERSMGLAEITTR